MVVVDDHAVIREGIRHMLEHGPRGCRVVGEAGTVRDAKAVIESARPDVAILDVVLPDGDGIQLCREIRTAVPTVACLILTSFPDPHALLSAALAGAAGYLPKDVAPHDLHSTVHALARGDRLIDENDVVAALERLTEGLARHPSALGQLTPQERRVFELVGNGLSNQQIAQQLNLTESTVKNYVSRLLSKLAMDRRAEAVALAARMAERRAQSQARGNGDKN